MVQITTNKIDGDVFRVINNMYGKAKACIMPGVYLSSFFSSSVGVRQGENLSPILFSLFLNDLTQFMSKCYDCLNPLTDEIDSMFDNKNVEVYLSHICFFMQTILAETAQELQNALDAI